MACRTMNMKRYHFKYVRTFSIFLAVMFVLFGFTSISFAQTCSEIIFSVDAPTKFSSSVSVEPYQAIQCKNNAYQTPIYFDGTGLPTNANVVGLTQLSDTKFLFTLDTPITISSTYLSTDTLCSSTSLSFETRDILLADKSSGSWKYCIVIDNIGGISSSVVIDALALANHTSGTTLPDLLLSFDVPVKSGATTYHQSDIVQYDVTLGTFSKFLDYSTDLELAKESNVVGFEPLGYDSTDPANGDYVFMFDRPETTTGIPSMNLRRGGWGWRRSQGVWDETTPFYEDTNFPEGNIGTDFMVSVHPGSITSGGVQLEKVGSGTTAQIKISWTTQCGSTNVAIYEGNISDLSTSPTSLKQITCGAISPHTFTPSSGNTFYLVIPIRYGMESSSMGNSCTSSSCTPRTRSDFSPSPSWCGTEDTTSCS